MVRNRSRVRLAASNQVASLCNRAGSVKPADTSASTRSAAWRRRASACSSPVQRWAPVYVGVCANDPGTATDSRGFAGTLAVAGIARAATELPIGHGMSHIHFARALSYLRSQNKRFAAPS